VLIDTRPRGRTYLERRLTVVGAAIDELEQRPSDELDPEALALLRQAQARTALLLATFTAEPPSAN